MIQEEIGKKIRKKRMEEELSQEQLALLSGVTPTYLGQVERGERNPTVGFLDKLSEALGIDINYFFRDDAMDTDHRTEQMLYHMKELNNEQKNSIIELVETIIKTMKEGQ